MMMMMKMLASPWAAVTGPAPLPSPPCHSAPQARSEDRAAAVVEVVEGDDDCVAVVEAGDSDADDDADAMVMRMMVTVMKRRWRWTVMMMMMMRMITKVTMRMVMTVE
jgi:hypothetical protein